MENEENKNTRTDLLRILIVTSSVLGIAGYYFHNTTFFLVFGLICACLVIGLTVFSLLTSPKAIMPIYLIYGFIFLLLMVIGLLAADGIANGLLLGVCFVGLSIAFMSRLIDWIHHAVMRRGPEWFNPEYDPFDENDESDDDDESENYGPILLDESASQEERIHAMSEAFCRMDDILSCLKGCQSDLRFNERTLQSLARYMDSGLWKEDFEAVESGKVDADIDEFGVLSEDGLYNLLEDMEETLKEFKELGISLRNGLA